MGRPRQDLQQILLNFGSKVYFQPPPNVTLQYPCILYEVDGAEVLRADNLAYRNTRRYSVTVIDKNPDSEIPDKVAELQLCSFDRFYTADNLNHYVYSLYF